MRKSVMIASTLMFGLLGCGDDDDDANGGAAPSSASATCARSCARAAAAACPAEPPDCQSQCVAAISQTPPSCVALVSAYATCVDGAVWSCDSEGAAEATACEPQRIAWLSCAGGSVDAPDAGLPQPGPDGGGGGTTRPDGGTTRPDDGGTPAVDQLTCTPQPGDLPCDTCSRASCCSELEALAAEPTTEALSTCFDGCAEDDTECITACSARYAAAWSVLYDYAECLESECEVECAEEDPTVEPPTEDGGVYCLPTSVPPGYCTDPARPVGHECTDKPAPDCVELPDVSDVYCCAS